MKKTLLALLAAIVLLCSYALFKTKKSDGGAIETTAAPSLAPVKPLPDDARNPSPSLTQPPAAVLSPQSVAPAAELLHKLLTDDGDENARDKRPVPLKALHKQFESETSDPGWSPNAEEALRGYLNSNADATRVQIIQVQCAATLCEIQAAGLSPAADMNSDVESWATTMHGMAGEPWWTEYNFAQPNYMVANSPEGQALFVSYAIRNPL